MERIINIKIFKSGKIDMDTKHWGVQNEKNITKLLFTFPEELESYNKEILFDFGMNQVVTDLILNNEYTVDNNVSCHANLDVAVRVTKQDGTKLFESFPESIMFGESLEPTDDMPIPEEVSKFNTMINTLNEKIEEVEETKEGVANISISAVKEGTATTITITKADGTEESFIVEDGKDYILTNDDKEEIVDTVKPMVETDIQPILENIENIAKKAETIAEGASQTLNYLDYEDMVTNFNAFDKNKFNTGRNIMIKKLNVPDAWIYGLSEEYVDYTYTTDEDLISLLLSNEGLQVGYYILSPLETQKVDLTDYTKQEQFVTLTQEEYDVLSTEGTYTREDGTILTFNANTYYYIIEEE